MKSPEDIVRSLPCWKGKPRLTVLKGGVTNANFKVEDETGAYVARVGGDCPEHHIFRDRELAVARAAAAAGLAPDVVYAAPGVSVARFLTARTFTEADVRANIARCVELVRRCHHDVAKHVAGPGTVFWVFHTLRDYFRTLTAAGHRHAPDMPRWAAMLEKLEAAQVPLPIVFSHSDLLPGNFMDDDERLWLIDWEYAGFGTCMFDLAGLSSNNSFTRGDERILLEAYFGKTPNEALWRCFDAMKTAAALREAVWGMVSELYLSAPGVDYVDYAHTYLSRFETARADYETRYGRLVR